MLTKERYFSFILACGLILFLCSGGGGRLFSCSFLTSILTEGLLSFRCTTFTNHSIIFLTFFICAIFRLMKVHSVLNGYLVAILPQTEHLRSVLKSEQSLSMLFSLHESSDVFTAIREHESAVAVHLIVFEISEIDTTVFCTLFLLIAFHRYASSGSRCGSIFAFLAFLFFILPLFFTRVVIFLFS